MATYDLTSNIPTPSSLRSGDILNCPYSGDKITIVLPAGEYQLECWGAQGGNYGSSMQGGYGGYSTGILALTAFTTTYLYAGGQPSSTTGGWNGGGAGYSSGRGGGGASDVRINENSLYARVIVAGGGGGSGVAGSSYSGTGVGGGIQGLDGYTNGTSLTGGNRSGGGGTQTEGGRPWSITTTSYYGSFGQGGSCNSSSYSAGGGGGGWYGGGAAYDNDSDADGRNGGGGSGYVYTSETASNYPAECLLTNQYYLGSASTINGATSFTDYNGTTVTGHSGNGAIRITVISALTPVAVPTLTNVVYTSASVSPTETNYNSTYMTKSGDISAIWPGTYVITYTLNSGYMWNDGTLTPKYVSWKITSPWKKKQPYIYHSSAWNAKTPWIYDSNFTL